LSKSQDRASTPLFTLLLMSMAMTAYFHMPSDSLFRITLPYYTAMSCWEHHEINVKHQ